jgi:hypothetical protein
MYTFQQQQIEREEIFLTQIKYKFLPLPYYLYTGSVVPAQGTEMFLKKYINQNKLKFKFLHK